MKNRMMTRERKVASRGAVVGATKVLSGAGFTLAAEVGFILDHLQPSLSPKLTKWRFAKNAEAWMRRNQQATGGQPYLA